MAELVRPTVKWGFIGAGWIAERAMAGAVHEAAGAELVAVASRSLPRAERLEPTGSSFGSYEALLSDPRVDVVYVCLSNEAHLTWVLAALAAGKHVLCEKPLGLTGAEVTAMRAAADGADRLLVEASWWQWHPRTARVRELLASGSIGAVRHVSAGFSFAGVPAGNYRLAVERGGGSLYDVGCYGLSAVATALPDVLASPVQSAGVTGRLQSGPTGVDLTSDLLLDLTGAATAEVHASIDRPERQWLIITGEAGELELTNPSFTAWRTDSAELLVSDGAATTREVFAPVDAYRLMVQAVCERVRGVDTWVVGLDQSQWVADVGDCARQRSGHSQPRRSVES